MVTYNGIAVTDEVNLYNEIFSLQAMYGAYLKQWDDIFPSFVNHNHTKSVGISQLTGIFIEPQRAITTNTMSLPENSDEQKTVDDYNFKKLRASYLENNEDSFSTLLSKLQQHIIGDHEKYGVNAPFIYNKDIVSRAFPEIIQNVHEGLIDISLLTPVLPGVYRHGDFLLFAHKYFRRGHSYYNTLNTDFLDRIEHLKCEDQIVKIAIDLDCIGLAGTEHKEYEYQYWWGPKFDDDLNSIPFGVTKHTNEKYNQLLSEFRSTEFGWYLQDNKHTFECEEITDIPNLSINGVDMYGCRFVHSMVDSSGMPIHLDGAIRAYDDEKMLKRLDISLKDSDRDTLYTKIWRIDGKIPVATWKELITHYYRDNMMIGEYFGGIDEKIISRSKKKMQKQATVSEATVKDFIPCDIQRGDGLRINLSFSKPSKNLPYDINLRPVFYNKDKQKFIESQTLNLYKLLKRLGLSVRYPFVTQISYMDQIYNYPLLECSSPEAASTALEAFVTLCNAWHKNGDDRIISFSFCIPYQNFNATISFLGHVDDFVLYFADGFNQLPQNENMIKEWLLKSYEYISKKFTSKKELQVFELLHSHGILNIGRCFVPSNRIKAIGKNMEATLLLDQSEIECIASNGITAVIAYQDNKSICSQCEKDYSSCGCISTIDENVLENITEAKPIGLVWTNRSAFCNESV